MATSCALRTRETWASTFIEAGCWDMLNLGAAVWVVKTDGGLKLVKPTPLNFCSRPMRGDFLSQQALNNEEFSDWPSRKTMSIISLPVTDKTLILAATKWIPFGGESQAMRRFARAGCLPKKFDFEDFHQGGPCRCWEKKLQRLKPQSCCDYAGLLCTLQFHGCPLQQTCWDFSQGMHVVSRKSARTHLKSSMSGLTTSMF